MTSPDPKRPSTTTPAADEVQRHLRRLLEILATELAKRWV
jgi:hypothetical protein